EKLLDRILVEIRIAHEFAAIREIAALALGNIMNRGRGACSGLLVAGPIEHRGYLQEPQAARTRRRRGDDFVAVITARERFAFFSLVIAKIVEGDEPAVGLHRGG